jgi:AraC-like DNA-binding protein/Ser/Thr protein kinase RdoA (MazF antagonist)
MDNVDIIQRSIDYIEENLKTDITAEELSNKAGFSLFHYYRIFQSEVGMPVMQYVLRRRLINAIFEISLNGKIIDIALSYGFDTHAGFFKAFRREFDCSPSQYLKKHILKKPYKINLKQEVCMMITRKKITEVLENWSLENEKIGTFYYESSGVKSDSSWYVGDDYILKSGNNLAALKQHIIVAKAVNSTGFETTIPVPTKDGKDYILEDDIYFCLTTRPKGECIRAREIYCMNYKAVSRYMGEILGQLHVILKKYDNEIICNESNIFDSVSKWALPKTKKIMDLPDDFYNDYIGTFGNLFTKLPKQVIHHNPTPSDFIMRDNKIAGFIEFEMSERSIRLFDPCYASTAILSESFVQRDAEKLFKWVDIYKNIIYGYDSVCKLTKEEKQALPYVVFSIQMMCVAYFSNKDKYKELAETNKDMLKWLWDNKRNLLID